MDNSAPDIQASLENADEIAELTGRTKSDVIADLLDDGKLNNSNAIKENTSAIDKATEMAGKTHKLLTALIPILLLVAGSGLELGGIIDLTPAGDDGEGDWAWEDDPYADVYWGCTDWDAINYDDWLMKMMVHVIMKKKFGDAQIPMLPTTTKLQMRMMVLVIMKNLLKTAQVPFTIPKLN